MLSELLAVTALTATFAAPTPRQALEARAKELGLPHADRIARDALPGARLVAGGKDVIGGTRFGGNPDLPSEMKWPRCGGARLSFLAQLRLSDVAAVAPGKLPREGTLAVFANLSDTDGVTYLEENGYGRVGAKTCVIVRELRGALARRATPRGVPRLKHRSVKLKSTLTVLDSLPAEARYGLTDAQVKRYWKLEDEASGGTLGRVDRNPRHQVLGWPRPVQDTPLYGCDEDTSKRLIHRLLLQLDFDPAAGFGFGDGGVFYLSGRPADLRAGRFSRLCVDFQQG